MSASRCPTCGKAVPTSPTDRPKEFPFCSQRCRLVDLGRWFDEEYRISTPIESPEQIEDVPGPQEEDRQEAPGGA